MAKILVIEDEKILREEILELLELEGFEAIGAENGQIGVRLAQEQTPDVIVCDVMMPKLDGYGVLSAIRQTSTTAITPFIFLTAKSTADDFHQGLRSGADDYITKPFRCADLLEAISTRLIKQAKLLELQQQVEELQQVNLLKDGFIGTICEEIREPLTNIMMATQMLQQFPTEERLQQYLSILQTECSRELNLIEDLLDLQQLETNSRPLKVEPLDLQEWIPLIAEPFQARAKKRQQSISTNISPHLSSVPLDCSDFRRILEELLDNACKYTAPGGKITLEAYRIPVVTTSIHNLTAVPTIVVSNEAEIPPETLPKLFEKFYRVPKVDRWHQCGNGLGLALVKKLVDRVNGVIQITSEKGWTHFILQLPS